MRKVRADNVSNAITVQTFSLNNSDKVTNKCYALNMKHYKHNEYVEGNIEKGKEGERMVMYFFKTKWGLPVLGNKLDKSYCRQGGPDIYNLDIGLYIEVKNNSGDYYLDLDWIRDQKVLEKFPENAKYKILILAHNKLLKEAREILDCANIKVVEWGSQLLGQNWNKAIAKLYDSMWGLYYKLDKFFHMSLDQVSSYVNKLHSIGDSKVNIESIQHKIIEYTVILDRTDKKEPPPRLGGWFSVPDLQRELRRLSANAFQICTS